MDKDKYKRILMNAGFSDEDACLFAEIHEDFFRPFNMNGVGYDIANSDNLSECEKEHLIRSCENYAFKGESFSQLDKNLLWKVRKCYHIRQMGLFHIAEPASFIDRLLF